MSSLSDVSFYVWNLLTSMLWPSWFTVVCVALLISLLYPTIVCFLCAYMYMYLAHAFAVLTYVHSVRVHRADQFAVPTLVPALKASYHLTIIYRLTFTLISNIWNYRIITECANGAYFLSTH